MTYRTSTPYTPTDKFWTPSQLAAIAVAEQTLDDAEARDDGRYRWQGTGMCGVGRWVKRSTYWDRDRDSTPFTLRPEDRAA